MTLPAALQPLADDASRAALLLDFDGSIAPIVDDPADATPLPATVDALRALPPVLAGGGGQRPRRRLPRRRASRRRRARRPLRPRTPRRRHHHRRPARGAVDRADRGAADAAEAALPGLLVERKGDLCVTIHWRTAPGPRRRGPRGRRDLARRYGIDAPSAAAWQWSCARRFRSTRAPWSRSSLRA